MSTHDDPIPEDLIDIYACYNDPELDRITQILADEGVETLVRDHTSHDFPTTIGSGAKKVIAVRDDDVDKSVALIRQAIADEVISPEGSFLHV